MESINLSEMDRAILNSYKGVAAGLADYLGSSYEIVLHSLENLEQSVIAIYHGEHSGRRIGSPVTDLALQMLTQIERSGSQDSITYFNRNRKGEPLKSSTIVIRGRGNRVIGLLCMNLYLNTPLFDCMQSWSAGAAQTTAAGPIETLAENSRDLIESSLRDAQKRVYGDPGISSSNRNREIIRQLNDSGIFHFKNAVVIVADLLHISKNTVYLHLRGFAGKTPKSAEVRVR